MKKKRTLWTIQQYLVASVLYTVLCTLQNKMQDVGQIIVIMSDYRWFANVKADIDIPDRTYYYYMKIIKKFISIKRNNGNDK